MTVLKKQTKVLVLGLIFTLEALSSEQSGLPSRGVDLENKTPISADNELKKRSVIGLGEEGANWERVVRPNVKRINPNVHRRKCATPMDMGNGISPNRTYSTFFEFLPSSRPVCETPPPMMRPYCSSPYEACRRMLDAWVNDTNTIFNGERVLLFSSKGRTQTIATAVMAAVILDHFNSIYNSKTEYKNFFKNIIGLSYGSILAASQFLSVPLETVVSDLSDIETRSMISPVSAVAAPALKFATNFINSLIQENEADAADGSSIPIQYDATCNDKAYRQLSNMFGDASMQDNRKNKLYIQSKMLDMPIKDQVIDSIVKTDAKQAAKNAKAYGVNMKEVVLIGANLIGFDDSAVSDFIDYFENKEYKKDSGTSGKVMGKLYEYGKTKDCIVFSFSAKPTSTKNPVATCSAKMVGRLVHIDFSMMIPENRMQAEKVNVEELYEAANKLLVNDPNDGAMQLMNSVYKLMNEYLTKKEAV